MSTRDESFFIGWNSASARPLKGLLTAVVAGVLALLAACALLLRVGIDDPSKSLFSLGSDARPEIAPAEPVEAVITGVFTRTPYALIHAAPEPAHPAGRVVMLSGSGKRGIDGPWRDGQVVEARGTLFPRGSVAMLVVDDIREAGPAQSLPVPQSLGTWRVVGEICDGKCYPGAMSPGSGLTHRACANLCLIGDVPMVFVAAAPVAGRSTLVLADAEGNRPPDAMRHLVALRVSLEGEVERRGEVLVFKVDFAKARIL